MTANDIAQAPGFQDRIDIESLFQQVMRLHRFMRPYDGWLAAGLLTLNLMVVVWSVESADWVPTPNLPYIMLLATITGLLVSRLPVWGALAVPLGLAIGSLVVMWQLVSFDHEAVALAGLGDLLDRLGLWIQAAKDGSINIDPVPFAFVLVSLSWLTGLLAAWMFVRLRHFWGVFILGGAGLFSNLTYLPDDANKFVVFWLFTALLLVARVQSVRRRRRWRERNLGFDGHLGVLSITDSFTMAAVVLLLAFFIIPKGGQWGPTNYVYEGLRTPLSSWEEDFNRLFAGLPARRALGFRIWGDTMPFQGTINPNTVPVLQVESRLPMYWKARTYDTYTGKGWISQGTSFKPLDWVPTYANTDFYLDQLEISYVVHPYYASKRLFGGGQVTGSSMDVRIETYESPGYIMDITDPSRFEGLPPMLERAGRDLAKVNAASGRRAADSALAASLPSQFKLLEVRRVDGVAQQVVMAESIPPQPDVLSVRAARGRVTEGEPYRLTSRVSLASPEKLRAAGTNYPTWTLVKYTQLPGDFPQSIRRLATGLTASSVSPYGKTKAIESHLRAMTYDLEIDPPPFGADGVEHFLFTMERGYSEYFASAMAVMLRSVGVPARMVTGYSVGDKIPDHEVYVVRDNHSHGWVEVFFPSYGWVAFEPTPGKDLPLAYIPEPLEREVLLVSDLADEIDEDCEEDIEECDSPDGQSLADGQGSSAIWNQGLREALPWLLLILGIIVLAFAGGRYLWWKFMEPSRDVEVLFWKLAALGRLNSASPKPYETPFQYGRRLGEVLPDQQGPFAVVIGSYVRRKYGRKEMDQDEISQLFEAWLTLRLPMLLRMFRPRNPQRTSS
ncbi:MAG: hypothetical protein BZY88_13885 [SAR202 cluster bacterium Io17-Chloro-G9]|nr:MAG: hypothetical protein BZY88_13885 [SAR202 cluster bacterium Io17-Chloro-G9]